MKSFYLAIMAAVMAAFTFTGCQTTGGGDGSGGNRGARTAMKDAIKREPAGTYYVGRRYYKVDYKFWGFVRKSGQPWSSAQLVMLNENVRLAPDRQKGELGSDNDHEYKLAGEFTGERVYEPASNGFYPEFRLRGYELLEAEPAPIYREAGATDPKRRVIAHPY
jgi:hypothetical protein